MKKIIVFASGSGSNAAQIMQHAQQSKHYTVAAVFTNNPKAGVLQKAQNYHVPTTVFNREELTNGTVLQTINTLQPHLIVLAGFLLKFPSTIIAAYNQKVINIHPALLPKYGGKGMYGMHVHRAVLENNETESGITIHYVNENYDEGNIILQATVNVADCTTAEAIAEKVLTLEHEHLPKTITALLLDN